jgi:sarcosine oxidase subunit beta
VPQVVVVGAGVIGASVAYHLAARGWRDVLVVDRADRPGLGSTGRATGGFRAQYATEVNVRLSMLARDKLIAFRHEIGVDPGYVTTGYLWLAGTGPALDTLLAAQRVQQACGLHEAMSVDRDDVRTLNPAVDGEGILGGVFCPTDGFLHPTRILNGYLEAARRLGVDVQWGVDVYGAGLDRNGRIVSLQTGAGSLAADHVVNAAGAWAGALGERLGVDVPVVPVRRQVAATVPTTVVPPSAPMTIFAEDGFHFRARDGRVLLLLPEVGSTGDPFAATVDDAWLAAVRARAHHYVPVLRTVAIDRASCWTGLYEVSPDRHALLGAHPACGNLYLANGSSGHGVMHAPALGHLLAELMTDGRASALDVAPLRPERFAEGAPNPCGGVL